jgi:cell division inhibitor SepF
MAGAMRKMAVYLGLVEDDAYDEEYEDYDMYEEEPKVERRRTADEMPVVAAITPVPGPAAEVAKDPTPLVTEKRPVVHQDDEVPVADLARIITLHPRTYNEARTIGEHFREGTPVIMNLTEMADGDAKRLVDFAAGLIFGLRGSIDRVTNKVFLLSPANVEVTAEDKARMAERGFFNQS